MLRLFPEFYIYSNLPMVFQSLELSDSYAYNFSSSQGLYLYRRIALLDGHFSITLGASEMCGGLTWQSSG